MNINKAIKNQNISYRMFMIAMWFIVIILPLFLSLLRNITIFFIIYLCILEILILLAITYRKSSNTLVFDVDNIRIKIKSGFPCTELNIFCEKIYLVHAEGTGSNMQLIFITKSKLRNSLLREIDAAFLRNYPYAGYHYGRIKKNNPENDYFYTVIKKGGYKKFALLDELYKCCTGAYYTDETIDQIKLYRNRK